MSQHLTNASDVQELVETAKLRPLSSTVAGSAGFTRLEIASARVLVKRLVRSGHRKGPSDYLLLSDSVLEKWWDEDAIAYLHEQYAARKAARGVVEIG